MSATIQRYDLLKKSVQDSISQIDDFEGLARDVLNKVVLETIKAYQQKLNVGIQDSVTDLIDNFKSNVTEAFLDAAAGWRIPKEDPFVFPRGCRFCFNHGKSIIVIIEEEPGIRSLSFTRGVSGTSLTHDQTHRRASVALPYTEFIFQFKRNGTGVDFKNMYLGWRTSPLMGMNDKVDRPVLPNIHDSFVACLGTNFTFTGTIAKQCDDCIKYFWNATFNDHLANYWWNKARIDERLQSVDQWETASTISPTFILGVRFPQDQTKTVKRIVDTLTLQESAVTVDENTLRHTLTESVDQCVENLFAKIMRYFKNTKFEKHEPKEVVGRLGEAMKGVNNEVIDLVFALDHEIKSLTIDITAQNTMPYEKRGDFWSKYSS